MVSLLKNFAADESGATAIEYGLITALIMTAVVTAMGTLGNDIGESFNNISTTLKSKTGGAAPAGG